MNHALLASCLLSISEYVMHILLFVVLRGAKKFPHATETILRFTKHFSLQPTYASRFPLLYFEYKKRWINSGATECCINGKCLCVVAICYKCQKNIEIANRNSSSCFLELDIEKKHLTWTYTKQYREDSSGNSHGQRPKTSLNIVGSQRPAIFKPQRAS